MKNQETQRPPPGPRPLRPPSEVFGLWVLASPDGDALGRVLSLDGYGSWSVGRGAGASLSLSDNWLSRLHFEVRAGPSASDGLFEWHLLDHGTASGTWVNGHLTRACRLESGDVVRAGATLFCLGPGARVPEADEVGLVGWSEALDEIRTQIAAVAGDAEPVHITGESGAGKEMVAAAVHACSGRTGPFLPLNMATLVPGLVESQLFGHRRGAFSGAIDNQVGAFVAAAGGTLLLDEIGDLELGLQAKLLRAAETCQVVPIGEVRPRTVDVHLVTTTHRDLSKMVADGTFREDLYWRLAPCEIRIPPLRERRMDVVPLFEHMLRKDGAPTLAQMVAERQELACHVSELLERLLRYPWPGNVRELKQAAQHLRRQIVLRERRFPSDSLPPLSEALPPRLQSGDWLQAGRPKESIAAPISTPGEEVARYKLILRSANLLRQAIESQAEGNVKLFAQQAGMALGRNPESVRRTIYRRFGVDNSA